MKKEKRLYNILIPIWLLWIFPQTWLIILPGNLLIDSAVLLLGLCLLRHKEKKAVYKMLWWKVYLLGFAADAVGVLWMLLALCLDRLVPPLIAPVMTYLHAPFYRFPDSLPAFLWCLAGVCIAGVCIYFFDRAVMRRCPLLTPRETHRLSLLLATLTAPYTFFITL